MINPFDLDPCEAREEFLNFLDQIERHFLSQMYDVHDDISYILYHHYHPKNMGNIHPEVIEFLKNNGLKTENEPNKSRDKANNDYYLAAYYGLETCNHCFENYKNMEFDSLVSNLNYAKSQLAIMEALSSTGEPKHKIKDTEGQKLGAYITSTKKYRFTRQLAYEKWEDYKQSLLKWEIYKNNLVQYEAEIDGILKEFEQGLLNDLTALAWKKKKTQAETDMINEMYTDSTTKPPLAIGWIKEIEGLPDRKKEKAKQKRFDRENKNSPCLKFRPKSKN